MVLFGYIPYLTGYYLLLWQQVDEERGDRWLFIFSLYFGPVSEDIGKTLLQHRGKKDYEWGR